jgi:hypothetical protein
MYVQTIARIIADKLGIKVIYSDTVPTFAIGKQEDGSLVIYMASGILKVFEGREEDLEAITRGALAHEALGHGFHTTFEAEAKTVYGRSIANALEDVRIERLAPSRYPGAKRALSEMVRLLIEQKDFWNPKDPILEEALLIGLLRHFRSSILGQPVPADITDTLLEQARKEIGDQAYGAIYDIAKGACFAATTKEVSDAADAIVNILKSTKKPPKPDPKPEPKPEPEPEPQSEQKPQQEPDPQTGEPGEPQPGEGTKGEAEDSQQDSAGEQSGADDSHEGDEGADDAGKDAGGSESSGDSEAGQGEETASQSEGSNTGQDGGDGRGGMPQSQSRPGHGNASSVDELIDFSDSVEVQTDINDVVDAMLGESSEIEGRIRGQLNDVSEAIKDRQACAVPSTSTTIIQRMKRSLGDALRATVMDEDDSESDFGRLDCSRIARIASGLEPRPFITDGEPGRGLSTELLVLFDKSGSMESLTRPFMASLVYAAGATLASFAPEVRFNVAFFDTCSTLVHQADKHWTPEHGAKVAGAYYADGGTAWAQSALPLLPILARSRKSRKVLLTVCDGDVDHQSYPGVMKEIKDHGIETTFLMIGRPVPHGLTGVSCDNTGESFAKAFGDSLLKAISPEFV